MPQTGIAPRAAKTLRWRRRDFCLIENTGPRWRAGWWSPRLLDWRVGNRRRSRSVEPDHVRLVGVEVPDSGNSRGNRVGVHRVGGDQPTGRRAGRVRERVAALDAARK